MVQYLSPGNFSDYELIDSGGFDKLEQFGGYIIARPEPQAVWDKALPEKEWLESTGAYFRKEKDSKPDKPDNNEKGNWELKKNMPGQWFVGYDCKGTILKFRLGLTAFKHVGIFPEQAENWDYIYDCVTKTGATECKVLNLFAYTGGASLAARAAGAEITHVDSVKQVVTWARENMEASGLENIRWIIEDAAKFVQREVKRGKKYNGIILDPPAYGRGPEGEKWILEKSLPGLMKLCKQLLDEENAFLVLNLYSMGFSPLVAESILNSVFGKNIVVECGELFVTDRSARKLPLGVFARFCK